MARRSVFDPGLRQANHRDGRHRLARDRREDTLAAQEGDRDGLASEEASRRLDVHGRNAIESGDAVSPLRILLHQFVSPLIYVLVVALFVTVAIEHYTDAVVIAAVLAVGIFWWALAEGATLAYAQTRSIVAKSPFSNPLLLIGTVVALAIHVGAMHFGPTQFLLGVEPSEGA